MMSYLFLQVSSNLLISTTQSNFRFRLTIHLPQSRNFTDDNNGRVIDARFGCAGYDADGLVVGMVIVEELFIGVGPVEYLDLLVGCNSNCRFQISVE